MYQKHERYCNNNLIRSGRRSAVGLLATILIDYRINVAMDKEDDHHSVQRCDETSRLLLYRQQPKAVSVSQRSLSSCVSYLLDPNHRPYRYLIALLVSLIEAMTCFSIEFPTGMQSTLIDIMELDNTQYNLIFSACSWPDIVMSIVGTVIVDKFLGMRRGLCIFSCILLAGQSIMCVGAYTNSFPILLCGRVVLGCSVGSLMSLTASFIIVWFEGKEVILAMSLSRCIHRLSATFALFTPQFLYDALTDLIVSPYYRHGTTLMLGTLLCLCAVLCALSVSYLDKRGAKIIGRKQIARKNISILNILSFSKTFWVLVLIISVYFAAVISFTANAPLYFMSKYGFSKKAAGIADSLSYLAIVFASPFFAVIIERVGYNLMWGLLAISFAVSSNVVYIITTSSNTFAPYLAAIMYSFSYTFFGSAMYATPGFVVPVHQLTTAYGMITSTFSIIATASNVSGGVVIDHYGYLLYLFFFIIIFVVIGLLSILLSVMEIVSENAVLNVSGKTRMKS